MKYTRKRKLQLLEQYPFCHWCGCKVFDHKTRQGESQAANLATIDHIYPRGDDRRELIRYKRGRSLVLACKKCNEERGREHEQHHVWLKKNGFITNS